jgi:DDE superfamily endonuclease
VSPQRRRVALYLRCRAHNLAGLDIPAFLRHLLRHLRGPIDLLWDRGPIHRRHEVRAFLAAHPRLRVHYFPAYAPKLIPAEYVWAQADHALANGTGRDIPGPLERAGVCGQNVEGPRGDGRRARFSRAMAADPKSKPRRKVQRPNTKIIGAPRDQGMTSEPRLYRISDGVVR